MIDADKKQFKWGPIDGKVLFIDAFMEYMVDAENILPKGGFPDCYHIWKKGKTLCVMDDEKMRKKFISYFEEIIQNKTEYEKWFKKWNAYAKKIITLSEQLENISSFSKEELIKFNSDFYETYKLFSCK